jgi:succinate dehydrogenase / fumarate reductase cytochrome b subunit
MLVELWAQGKALDGPLSHREALDAIRPAHWLARALILAPLLFHAAYGLYLAASPRYNVGRYPLSGNWTYTLQRASGLAAFGFIVLHAALFWRGESSSAIVAALSTTKSGVPWLGLVYLLGVGACTFHLAAGCWTFLIRWGFTPTAREQAEAGVACAIVGAAIFLWGANTVVFLATGWRVAGQEPSREMQVCEPPSAASASAAPAGASR